MNSEELKKLIEDYKQTYWTVLLKWVLLKKTGVFNSF